MRKKWTLLYYGLLVLAGLSTQNVRRLFADAAVQSSTKNAQSSAPKDLLQLGTPLKQVPFAGAELRIINPIRSRLVYAVTNVHDKKYPSYIVLKVIDFPKKVTTKVYTFMLPTNLQSGENQAFDPQLSPDGRYILFKFGAQWSTVNSYQLYIIDTKTNKLTIVSERHLVYKWVSWSPDGKYIVYLEGGDAVGRLTAVFGDSAYNLGPLSLYISDWQNKKEYNVITNNTALGSYHYHWLGQHTLLYGVLSDKGQKVLQDQEDQKTSNQNVYHPRPNVYAFSPEENTSTLLIKDAYMPIASPNGQLIAFFGSENPQKPFPLQSDWQFMARGAALSVANKDGTGRRALNVENNYPHLRWLPDSRHLLSLQLTKASPKAEAQLKEWDVQTGKFRLLATLHANDYEPSPRAMIEPQFFPADVSADGKHIFIFKDEYVDHDPTLPMSNEKFTLSEINISSGTITPVLSVLNCYGIDWQLR